MDGVFYFRQGNYSGKKKKQLQTQIKNGETPQKWEVVKKNKIVDVGGEAPKASNSNSLQYAKKKKIINGDLLSWLQT